MKKLVLVICLAISLILFSAKLVFAQIFFSEVYPQPRSEETEWLELVNQSNQSVNLLGWTIEDILSSPKVIYTFSDLNFLPNHLLVATISSQLNNTGDGVVLKDGSGQVIATMNYDSSTLGMSWTFTSEEAYTESNPTFGWHYDSQLMSEVVVPTATPSAQPSPAPEIIDQVQPTSTPVSPIPPQAKDLIPQLQRISACPKTGPEWLEWFNPHDTNLQVSLLIKDLQNNSLGLELQLAPLEISKTLLSRNIFNNNGDEVFVYFQNRLILSQKIPACSYEDMIFSLLDKSGIAENGIEQVAGEQKLAIDDSSQANREKNEERSSKSGFVYPQSVLSGSQKVINKEMLREASSSSYLVSGEQRPLSDPNLVSLVPSGLLILGGFLWLGLGIIVTYGQQIFGRQAVDQGFFASSSLG